MTTHELTQPTQGDFRYVVVNGAAGGCDWCGATQDDPPEARYQSRSDVEAIAGTLLPAPRQVYICWDCFAQLPPASQDWRYTENGLIPVQWLLARIDSVDHPTNPTMRQGILIRHRFTGRYALLCCEAIVSVDQAWAHDQAD